MVQSVKDNFTSLKMTSFGRFKLRMTMRYHGLGRKVNIAKHFSPLSEDKLEDAIKERGQVVDQLNQVWQKEGLTALITPVWPGAPPALDQILRAGLLI